MVDLHEAVDGWTPGALEATEVIGAWPVAAFSAALELTEPVARQQQPLPLLWHWFHFLESPRPSELAERPSCPRSVLSAHSGPAQDDRRWARAGTRPDHYR
jgi:3-methylfumaryl-CoA hydratase